jgi:glycosyltransferase involved in cell wall biosynthesis
MTIDVFMIGLRNISGTQGGIETHVHHLSRELDQLGLRVAVAVRSPYAPRGQVLAGTNIRIIRLWSPSMQALETIVHSIIAILYAAVTRPRLVHVHAVGPSVVLPLARLFGLKVIATHHGEDYRREKWGPVARLILRCGETCQAWFAHGLICVSRSLSKTLASRHGREFRFIPNGVARMDGHSHSGILHELALTPQRYMLAVSRLVPEKRHLDLIEAFAGLRRERVKLVIVGAADHESAYSKRLYEAARRDRNIVLAGFRKGAQLSELYEHAAVFALPSSHEGLPIALLEAMAHGLKIVASDIPAHRDLELGEQSYHPVGNVPELGARLRVQLDADTPRPDWSAQLQPLRWDAIAAASLLAYRDVDPRIGAQPQPIQSPPLSTAVS